MGIHKTPNHTRQPLCQMSKFKTWQIFSKHYNSDSRLDKCRFKIGQVRIPFWAKEVWRAPPSDLACVNFASSGFTFWQMTNPDAKPRLQTSFRLKQHRWLTKIVLKEDELFDKSRKSLSEHNDIPFNEAIAVFFTMF